MIATLSSLSRLSYGIPSKLVIRSPIMTIANANFVLLHSCWQRPRRALSSLRENYLQSGVWAEKETMDVYLRQALEISSKYIAKTKLSLEEEGQYRIVKDWYQKEYIPQPSNLLPFLPLEAVGKDFERCGGDHLTKKEISCYLSEGVVGPTQIKSVTSDQLRAIFEKFSGFHKDHNRNLGSVFAMLQNRCLYELVTNREILAKVSSILGENIMVSSVTINELAPGIGKSTMETGGMVDALNCHSDLSSGSQYHFEVGTNRVRNLALDNRCVNVWLSVTGTDEFNAPLYFFPRTHTWEITTPFTHIDRAKDYPETLEHVLKLLSCKQGSPARRIGLYAMEYRYLFSSCYKPLLPTMHRIEMYTKPAECIMFNAHTRHGSGVNLSAASRMAITLRFNTALTEAGGMESAGSVATLAERRALGIGQDTRKPMIQVLGQKHHPHNIPIEQALGRASR